MPPPKSMILVQIETLLKLNEKQMKLIRDNLHNYIEDKNKVKKINPADMRHWLIAKLREETEEVCTSPPGLILEELADVYEVLLALGAVYGHTLNSIQAFADQKRSTLGGFRDGWILKE